MPIGAVLLLLKNILFQHLTTESLTFHIFEWNYSIRMECRKNYWRIRVCFRNCHANISTTAHKAPARKIQQDFEWEIPYSELELGAKLGEGTFGVGKHFKYLAELKLLVYRAKWRGLTVAVKELKTQAVSADVIEDFRKEISILAYVIVSSFWFE